LAVFRPRPELGQAEGEIGMRRSKTRLAAVLAAGLLTAMASGAVAQVPPPGSEAANVAACLCLKHEVDALSAETAAKQHELADLRAELGRIDSQLEAERTRMDVNNPESVARFRQLLQRRDELFQRSTNDVAPSAASTVERYNARIGEYNSGCANRPRDPRMLAEVQATLVCPRL
jgi:hypothetical protein